MKESEAAINGVIEIRRKRGENQCENNGDGISVKQRASGMPQYGISRSEKIAKYGVASRMAMKIISGEMAKDVIWLSS
jgi:hypothetical protein